MARLLLRDLTPGATYELQLRAVDGDTVSEWSRLFELPVSVDSDAPDVPAWDDPNGWVVNGDTFVANWLGLDENANQNLDFDYYELSLSDGTTAKIIKTTNTSYTLTFEDNVIFFGQPRATVYAKVRAVDNMGNASAYNIQKQADNPAPAAVFSVTAESMLNGVKVDWTPSSEADFKDYLVQVSTTSSSSGFTTVHTTTATSYVYGTLTETPHWFRIIVRDKFNTSSSATTSNSATPESPFDPDDTAPDVPTSLAATLTNNANGIGAVASVTWNQAQPAANDLARFYIRWRETGATSWNQEVFNADSVFVSGTSYAASIVLPKAYVGYEFQAKSTDWTGNESAWTAVLTKSAVGAGNPAQISGVVSTPTPGGVRYTWTASAELNIDNYEAQIATDSGFTTGVLTFNTGKSALLVVNALTPSTTYYFRVRARNTAGNYGSYSATDTETSGDYNSTITAITADIIQPSTLGNPITLGAGSALILSAGYIKSNTYNGANGADEYDSGATAGFYLGNDGLRIAQGSVSASALASGTLSTASIEMTGTGEIKTSGYVEGTSTSGFRLYSGGLQIPNGSIVASKLVLQQSQNMINFPHASFEFTSSYYLTSPTVGNNISVNVSTDVSMSIDTTTVKYGTQSLKIQQTSALGRFLRLSSGSTNNIIIPEPGEYILSYWIYPTVTNALTLRMQDGVNSISPVGSASTGTLTANTWQRKSAVFNITSTGALAALTIPAVVGTWYIDGVQLERKVSGSNDPSAFSYPSTTIISGGMIQTGEIRSTSLAVDQTGATIANEPAWSIDMEGDAVLGNVKVRGSVLVGEDGDSFTSIIQSANYEVGAAGWIIRSDGYAEFRQLASDSISGDVIKAGTLSVDTLSSGSLGGDISLVDAGIYSNGPVGEQVGFNEDGFTVKGAPQITVTSYSITSNVATVTASGAHDILVGNVVRFSQLTGTTIIKNNTLYTVTARTSTTFSFALTNADVASTSITGLVHGGGSGGAKTVPILISFPSDGSSPNILSSTVETTSLVAVDTVIESDLHLQFGSTLRIASGVDNPTVSPNLTATLKKNNFSLPTGRGAPWGARATVGHDDNFYVAQMDTYGVTVGANFAIRKYTRGVNDGGTVVYSAAFPEFGAAVRGLVYVEGSYWLLYESYTSNWLTVNYKVLRLSTSFVADGTTTLASLGANNNRSVVLGMDHTNADDLLLLYATGTSATIKHFDIISNVPTAGLADLTFTFSGTHTEGFAGVVKGTFDFGATRIIVKSSEDKTYYVYNTSGVNQSNDQWQTYATNVDSAFYDSIAGQFAEINDTTGVIWYNTGEAFWSGAANVKKRWWVGYTWYDSVGTTHETAMSPFASVDILKRRWISVDVPNIPSGGTDTPNQARTWSIQQTNEPANNTAGLAVRAVISHPNKSAYLDFVTTPTVTGGSSANGFSLLATSAQIVSTSGNSFWKGDDSARFYKLALASNEEASTSAGNKPALRVGNIDTSGNATGPHLRIDSDEINAMSTDSAVGTFYLNSAGETRVANGNAGSFRIGNAGTPFKTVLAGTRSATPDASGDITVTHNLAAGASDYHAFVQTHQSGVVRYLSVISRSTNSFVVRVRSETGAVVTSGTIDFSWIVYDI